LKVFNKIYPLCAKNNIKIRIVLGAGNRISEKEISSLENVEIFKDVKDMSVVLKNSDIAFTSGGRSAFEVYSMRIPTIVICQNEKELTHSFANLENGFHNLGLAKNLDDTEI